MSEEIHVLPYNPEWQQQFLNLALPIREKMGGIAKRIDHIGSTSIVGLAAKPVIDIQISVLDFVPFEPIQNPLASLGYRWQADNPDKTKRYFREPLGIARVHIHLRRLGSWSEQHALLFRDYLRTNQTDRDAYGALKMRLAQDYRHHREGYQDAKSALIWEITQRAHLWTFETGWYPSESDV